MVTDVDLHKMAVNRELISLIKLYREFTNCELKKAKETIETALEPDSSAFSSKLNADEIISIFKNVSYSPHITDEQFLNMVERAIKSKHVYHFEDQLDAVETLCKNIRRRGGLNVIAKEYEDFIDAI